MIRFNGIYNLKGKKKSIFYHKSKLEYRDWQM